MREENTSNNLIVLRCWMMLVCPQCISYLRSLEKFEVSVRRIVIAIASRSAILEQL